MLNAFRHLLCSLLCQHNWRVPSQALDIWYFMCSRHSRASGSLKSHHSLTQAVLWSSLNHWNAVLCSSYAQLLYSRTEGRDFQLN